MRPCCGPALRACCLAGLALALAAACASTPKPERPTAQAPAPLPAERRRPPPPPLGDPAASFAAAPRGLWSLVRGYAPVTPRAQALYERALARGAPCAGLRAGLLICRVETPGFRDDALFGSEAAELEVVLQLDEARCGDRACFVWQAGAPNTDAMYASAPLVTMEPGARFHVRVGDTDFLHADRLARFDLTYGCPQPMRAEQAGVHVQCVGVPRPTSEEAGAAQEAARAMASLPALPDFDPVEPRALKRQVVALRALAALVGWGDARVGAAVEELRAFYRRSVAAWSEAALPPGTPAALARIGYTVSTASPLTCALDRGAERCELTLGLENPHARSTTVDLLHGLRVHVVLDDIELVELRARSDAETSARVRQYLELSPGARRAIVFEAVPSFDHVLPRDLAARASLLYVEERRMVATAGDKHTAWLRLR